MNQQSQSVSQPERDRTMTDYLYTTLRDLPLEIAGLETYQVNLSNSLREVKAQLEDAELNALLSAPQDAGNEKARELQRKAAIKADPNYQKLRKEAIEIEGNIDSNEANCKSMRREFQAALALAELHAARINAMTKIQNNKKEN